MKKKENYSYFQGARLSETDSNRVGVGVILGIIGVFVSLYVTDLKNLRFLIITIFAGVGFFILGPILFKSKKPTGKSVDSKSRDQQK